MSKDTARVMILMGSDSDLEVMLGAAKVLAEFEIGFDLQVLSVHRAPEKAMSTARAAKGNGFEVIIAGAGGAAHLAGAVAASTTLPVIGVPIDNGPLRGLDALYATVQMPPGVPVATVAINGARNAGLLAAQVLAIADEGLAARLERYKETLVGQVEVKNRNAQGRLAEEGLA